MLITHRCTKCKHPDYRRHDRDTPDGAYQGTCGCGCKCRPGKPEVVPTFDQAGARVERIAKPGARIGEDLGAPEQKGQIVTCGCEACRDLHKSLTTV